MSRTVPVNMGGSVLAMQVDRQLHRELAAVGAHARQLDRACPAACPRRSPRSGAGRRGGCSRSDGGSTSSASSAPDRLLRRAAEHPLGGAVELDDVSLVVDRDDRVQRGGEHRRLAGLALRAPPRPRPRPRRTRRSASRARRSAPVGRDRARAPRAANSSITATHSPPARIGNASAPRRPDRAGRLHARELVGLEHVREPGGQAALPDGPGQPEAMAHDQLACGLLELGRLEPGRASRWRRPAGRLAAGPPRGGRRPSPAAPRSPAAGAGRPTPASRPRRARARRRTAPPAGGVALAVGAQARDADGQAADQADRGQADQLVGRAEVVAGRGRAGSPPRARTAPRWRCGRAWRRRRRRPGRSAAARPARRPSPKARSTAATAQTAISESRNTPRPSRTPPVWVCEPNPTPDYFRASAPPIYNGGNARI